MCNQACHVSDLHESGDFDVVVFEWFSSVEVLVDEFDEEVHVGFLGVEFVDEVECRLHGSSCSEQVVV